MISNSRDFRDHSAWKRTRWEVVSLSVGGREEEEACEEEEVVSSSSMIFGVGDGSKGVAGGRWRT